MNLIQYWFDRLAGITLEEQRRLEFARQIFRRDNRFSALHTPACWRRKPRLISGWA